MLAIIDNTLKEYLQASKEHKLDEALNIKKFTVGSSPLNSRKTNALDHNNLLGSDRENKTSWRKFSYKELLYFHIIFALREFGVKNDQLMPLWESFFKEPVRNKTIEWQNKADADVAIGCAWGGIEMTLLMDEAGNVVYADPLNTLIIFTDKPHIRIPLNEIVNKLNKQSGLELIPVVHTLQSIVFNNASTVTVKEKELLKIIRDNEYLVIKVQKKDGEIFTIYAEKTLRNNEATMKNLEAIIAAKKHVNINIIQRDGNIVNYKIIESIKL